VDALLDKVSRLDQPSDILAEISRQAKSRLTAAPSHPSAPSTPPPPPPPPPEEVVREVEEETDVQEVAETMRRSGHLWMKIVSKYAVAGESPKRGGAPAAGKKLLETPGSAAAVLPDAAAELEMQRQKLVEVGHRYWPFRVTSSGI